MENHQEALCVASTEILCREYFIPSLLGYVGIGQKSSSRKTSPHPSQSPLLPSDVPIMTPYPNLLNNSHQQRYIYTSPPLLTSDHRFRRISKVSVTDTLFFVLSRIISTLFFYPSYPLFYRGIKHGRVVYCRYTVVLYTTYIDITSYIIAHNNNNTAYIITSTQYTILRRIYTVYQVMSHAKAQK